MLFSGVQALFRSVLDIEYFLELNKVEDVVLLKKSGR